MTKWLDFEKEPPTKEGNIVVLIGNEKFIGEVMNEPEGLFIEMYEKIYFYLPKTYYALDSCMEYSPFIKKAKWKYPSHFKHPEKYCYLPEIEDKE